MSAFKDYKLIAQRNKDLINGYVRDIQKLLPVDQNTYFTIPISINQLCVIFYTIKGEFNTEQCSKNLEFIDEKTVQKINNDNHALCLFGEPISNSMCRIFKIEFTIRQKGNNKFFCPYFGLAVSSSISDLIAELKTIKKWDDNYAKYVDKNGHQCLAYSVSMYNSTNEFRWNGSTDIKHDKLKFVVGDRFSFVHDFATSPITMISNYIHLK